MNNISWTPILKDGVVKKGIDEKTREYMMSRDGTICATYRKTAKGD